MTGAWILAIKEGMTEALSRRLKQERFDTPAQEALLSVIVAANALNDLMDRLCEKHRITRAQYNVLRILRGVHPQGHARCEIARRMLDRASDITRLVDRLQARRLVKRFRGSEDQREVVTCITAKGLKLLETMQPQIDAETSSILGRLSDEDCRELSRLCALIFGTAHRERKPQRYNPRRLRRPNRPFRPAFFCTISRSRRSCPDAVSTL
jgi:DNA-binding MarR family transcriptional regulator